MRSRGEYLRIFKVRISSPRRIDQAVLDFQSDDRYHRMFCAKESAGNSRRPSDSERPPKCPWSMSTAVAGAK